MRYQVASNTKYLYEHYKNGN